MKDKKTVLGYAVGGTGTDDVFGRLFGLSCTATEDLIEDGTIDCLVLWGGQDISPTIYKERPSRMCGAGVELSRRDKYEVGLANAAIKKKIPIIGVCRGAQLACAMAGGSLIQHVNSHTFGNHNIVTSDGRTLVTSSVHHQMMYPWKVEHSLLAWTPKSLSTVFVNQDNENHADMMEGKHPEPEIVYFPRIHALAIQGHPEFMSEEGVGKDFINYCLEKANELF